jgi:cytoskeletal protein CcmA (bactofilin family)
MWNRRKDEEFTPPRPVTAPSVPAEPKKETSIPTMSSAPGRIPEAYPEIPRSGGTATLGKSVMVKGQIVSREDLTIDGEVEGTVELHEHRLTIGPNGKVNASLKAREIIVLGTINGNVEATDKIDIRKEARLVGDIKTARIVIEDGAFFKGSIDIIRTETPKQQAAKAQPQGAPAPAPAPVPVPAASHAVTAAENKR